jgi:hypothetical protein
MHRVKIYFIVWDTTLIENPGLVGKIQSRATTETGFGLNTDTLDGIDICARSSGLVNPRWEAIVHQVDNTSEIRTLISNE